MILNDLLRNRIKVLRQILEQINLDTLIVSISENRYYLSGFTSKDSKYNELSGLLFINQNKILLVTDGRFITQAFSEAKGCEILCLKSSIQEELPAILDRLGMVRRIGIESDHISHKFYNELLLIINKSKHKINLVPTEGIIERMRAIKTGYEIKQIKKGLRLAESAFKKLLPIIRVNMTEKELAFTFEKIIMDLGADELAFPTIIASGPNSAMPHAETTNRKLKAGEPILIDWGIKLGGYCSDTSRTLILGSPDAKFVNVYNTVMEAQKRATAIVKNGISASEVDFVAREYINKTEYYGSFLHSIGHGIGLEIHEAPKLSKFETKPLKSGMVITIEPGIYIPNWGGIRLENQLVVCDNSCLVLNEDKESSYKIKFLEE